MHVRNPSGAEPQSDRELTLRRVFSVPARVLFEAHSRPEHVLQWFGPPGCPLAVCEMDFRVGGRYRFAMKGPDGALMAPFGGEYLEIVKDRKISYSNTTDHAGAETMLITVTFEEHAGSTTIILHTLFASARQKREHLEKGYEIGAGSALEQLAEVASRMALS